MPGSTAELLVKAKQGYPQSNVHIFIYICNLRFKRILMLFAVPKKLNHLNHPDIFILNP